MRPVNLRRVTTLHRLLRWPALLALLVFALSGAVHLLMTWTSPQPVNAMPPKAVFSPAELAAIPGILQRHGIESAKLLKLVPGERGNLLQLTEGEQQPRRYFSPTTGEALPDMDRAQAIWLASRYSGRPAAEVSGVEFLTHFDSRYPWVNRLLPVYRVSFAGEAGLVVSVHTETGALADMSSHWKRQLQWLFLQFHTWQWLDALPHGRVLLMLVLLSSLLGMIGAGAGLLFGLPARRIPRSGRRWHRRLAHLVWLPLLGFTASGVYHLLYQAYAAEPHGLRLGAALALGTGPLSAPAPGVLPDQPLHAVALVPGPDGRLLFRASVAGEAAVPAGEHAHHGAGGEARMRQARFDGVPAERGGLYLAADTGQRSPVDDAAQARALAEGFMRARGEQIPEVLAVEKISRFGPGYDFRNKRLPVWRVAFAGQKAEVLFVDPATGVLVDRLDRSARVEALSFSLLHKWNFLSGWGREQRDALLALAVLLSVLLGLIGSRWVRSRPGA